jgi:3,4-dihydroxy 2-butanone 4-phosphate synthase/GTP cyclohydrolase II
MDRQFVTAHDRVRCDVVPPREIVRVPLPTQHGTFEARAFAQPGGHVYVALVLGEVAGDDVLVRIHSECLTGDALGSLRCDCGVQLRRSLQAIAAEQRGVLVYATGHEGRGIGLLDKLRAYVAQDGGADTVDANLALGLPVDTRDYGDAAAVLAALGVRSIRLMTNNPRKVSGLRASGAIVDRVVPLPTAPHHRNRRYLDTKVRRLGHTPPGGAPLAAALGHDGVDVLALLGDVRPRADRPFVVLKYAQTLDGRIATSSGDSKWISGEAERCVAHGLRAACDAVLVGAGTVRRDDPRLTVRMVPGASPSRVVLDGRLALPTTANVFGADAATVVMTTDRADPQRCGELRRRGVRVEVVDGDGSRVEVRSALSRLRQTNTESVLVEGGSQVITSLLAAGVVDRIIVAVAPLVIGDGTPAVRSLGIDRVTDGIRLVNRSVHTAGDDVLLAWDVAGHR